MVEYPPAYQHSTVVFWGGIPIGSISEVVGRAGVGKHLAQQVTVQAAMEVVHIYWCWEEISLQRLIQVLR